MNNSNTKKEDFRKYYNNITEYKDGGNFVKIYTASLKNSNEKRAIKVTDKVKIKKELEKGKFKHANENDMKPYKEGFLNEVNFMQMIEGLNKENKNTVKFYESFETEKEFVIVMELCDENLLDVLINRENPFNDEEVYEVLSQLNYTFRIMVEKKIVHRDLKLENILVKYENINDKKNKYTLKLTDYGVSKQLYTLTKKMQTQVGTYNYMAPEVLQKKPNYTIECDLWSLGIIIYNLCFKEYPYNATNAEDYEEETLNLINKNGQNDFKTTNNNDLNELLKGLLIRESEKRLTWKNYFAHPFFVKRDFGKYYDIEKISEGGYGVVYKAKHKKNNQERAIKVIKKNKIKEGFIRETLRQAKEEDNKPYIDRLYKEIEYMEIIEGPDRDNKNTVKFYEYFDNKDEFAIVMELCDENLANLLERKGTFTVGEIYDILIQLNNTFRIMAKNNIAHRDLKLENILVKYDNKKKTKYTLKLTDYGVSKQLISMSTKFITKGVGTFGFISPEVLLPQYKEYNEECDLWSLGIIIYILFFNENPIGESNIAYYNNLKELNQYRVNSTDNENLDDLIQKLLIKDPKQRIKWNEYFEHPFFKKKPEPNIITINLKVYNKDKFNKVYFLDNDFKMKNDPYIENYKENEEIKNLIENNKIELYINGNKQNIINKFFKPDKEGEYKIKIIFHKKIKDCSYMFSWCDNIISIDLSSFDSSSVTKMKYMFGRCHYLEEIILNNLNTENVTDMSYMFNKCSSLKEIDLPKSFKTNKVENMEFMFHYCQELKKINFSPSFQTNNVTNMKVMFGKCFLLEKLDLQNFNTKKVKDMSYMFNKCTKLKYINLSSFSGENIDILNSMFSECETLKDIDLSSFVCNKDMNKQKFMNSMFKDCCNLEKINLSSFKVTDNDQMINMFENTDNIKIIKVVSDCLEIFKKKCDSLKSKFTTN